MKEKKSQGPKLLSDQLQKEITEIVDEVLEKKMKISAEELAGIILTDLDKMISNKLKAHFVELAQHIIKTFGDQGDQ